MSRYTQGYIPPNLGKITFMDGRIQLRNAGEAIVGIGLAFLVHVILSKFLPPTISFAISALLGLGLGVPALFGIGGEPLSVFLLNVINYSNGRTYVTLRPPQREIEGINTPKPKKESRLESAINSMFIGGESAPKEKPVKKTKEEKLQARLDAKQNKAEQKANARMEKERAKANAKMQKQQAKMDAKIAKMRAKQEKRR